MPDHNRLREYEDAKTQAEARRHQGISEAYRAFNVKHAETMRKHREAYMAARADWDTVKSAPEAEGHEEARQAFIDANAPADHTEARAEMDRALRAADAAYNATMVRLRAEIAA
jgi:hypothetical protein